MPTIQRPGADVVYDVSGHGPPLLLGHSLFCTRSMWNAVVPRLREHFQVINIALRGHGESSATAPFTLWDLVDDWAAVMDAEGIGKAALCGLSTGGFTAMRFALKLPERVQSLVLLDTSADAEPLSKRLQYAVLGQAYKSLGLIPRQTVAKAMFKPNTRAEHPERFATLLEQMRGFDRKQLAHAMRAIFGRDSVDVSPITAPTLVASGEFDHAVPPSRARRIANMIQGSRLETIKQAGHLSAVEQPERVAELIIDHVSRVASHPDAKSRA